MLSSGGVSRPVQGVDHRDEAQSVVVKSQSVRMLIVGLEKCVQAWSNGRYESAVHQVLLTEKQKWRMSVIYALNPPSNILVSAPEELVDEEHPRKFRDFAWPDYIHNMRSNRHRIRDKVALDFITIGAKNRWEE